MTKSEKNPTLGTSKFKQKAENILVNYPSNTDNKDFSASEQINKQQCVSKTNTI